MAYELHSGVWLRLWQDQLGSNPPFDIGPQSLFVAYSAAAEFSCFHVLGWSQPARILDLFVEYVEGSKCAPVNPETDPFLNLRLTPEQLKKYYVGADGKSPAAKEAVAKKAAKLRFYQFPAELYRSLLTQQTDLRALLCVLGTLIELWFENFGRNPVNLTSCSLQKYGISRHQKLRALAVLKKSKFFSVEQSPGKNPMVTLTWLPRVK